MFYNTQGYGHYINRQLLNEPLEEMMGKLLEEHPEAAAQLLKKKGLFLMPLSLVDDFQQAIQTFGGIPRVWENFVMVTFVFPFMVFFYTTKL